MRERTLQCAIDSAVGQFILSLTQRTRPGALGDEYLQAALYHSQGRLEEASEGYRAALARSDKHVEARAALAACHFQQGSDSAVSELAHAVAEIPIIEGAQKKCAGVLFAKIGMHTEALPRYREALLTREEDAELHFLLAQSLRATGRHARALVRLQDAIRLKPDYHEAMELAGIVLIETGHLEEGRRAFRKAIKIAPHIPSYYRSWAVATKVTPGDKRLAAVELLLSGGGDALADGDRADLHYALGKAFDDLGSYDAAFHHMSKGKAAARRLLLYNEAEVHAAHRELIAEFSADWLSQMAGCGFDSDVPVFIVGMPRSGSTLVEQIVASHPEVRSIGERPLFHQIWARIFGNGFERPRFSGAAGWLEQANLLELGRRYVDRAAHISGAAKRVTDKTLANFSLVGLIAAALPNAKIIHVQRHPADNCLSCFFTSFSNMPFAADLGELGRFYMSYRSMMRHWDEVLPHGRMLDVRYEDLVADPDGTARRIVSYCGLDWNDNCLKFHETRRAVQTASAIQVRKPIYGTSVGRWVHYRHLLDPLLREIGSAVASYPRANNSPDAS